MSREFAINITDLGAVGDGRTDDTKAFFKAIEILSTRDIVDPGALCIPSGEYLISQKLNFHRLRGCMIFGTGGLRLIGGGAPLKGSILTWVGEPGETMIEYSGTQCSFQNLALYGHGERTSPEKRAGILWHNTSGKGLGSGKNTWYNMTFRNADTGIRCGDKESDGNIDYLSYFSCLFRELGTAYHVVNRQSVGHYFSGITYLSQLDRAFRFDGGGNFALDMALLTKVPTYLSLPGQSQGVGINNASYRTRFMDYDNHTGGVTPQLLVMDDYRGAGSRSVRFDEVRMHKFSQLDDDRPLFDFGGDMLLQVNGFADLVTDRHWCKIRTDDSARKQTSAIFEHCFIHGYAPPSKQYGKVHWVMRENFDAKTGAILPTTSYNWEDNADEPQNSRGEG